MWLNTKQGIHRYQTPAPCHNAASGSRPAVHVSPYGPLRPNVTSSIKPEVRKISQRCQRRTEPRPQWIRTQNFVKIGPAVPEICSRRSRHTDRQTDKLIAVLRSPTAGGVKITSYILPRGKSKSISIFLKRNKSVILFVRHDIKDTVATSKVRRTEQTGQEVHLQLPKNKIYISMSICY